MAFESTPGSTWTEQDWAVEVERQKARAERAEAEVALLRAELRNTIETLGADARRGGRDMTPKECRWCGKEIVFIEPEASCGWAHVAPLKPGEMRFWCGYDEATSANTMRQVEPWVPSDAVIGGEDAAS